MGHQTQTYFYEEWKRLRLPHISVTWRLWYGEQQDHEKGVRGKEVLKKLRLSGLQRVS